MGTILVSVVGMAVIGLTVKWYEVVQRDARHILVFPGPRPTPKPAPQQGHKQQQPQKQPLLMAQPQQQPKHEKRQESQKDCGKCRNYVPA